MCSRRRANVNETIQRRPAARKAPAVQRLVGQELPADPKPRVDGPRLEPGDVAAGRRCQHN
eukprot:9488962-Pyramimonas_sp.AAC.1